MKPQVTPFSYAIKLLSRREHSQFELHQKLSRKFPHLGRNDLETLIDQLAEAGYQSDLRFAEAFIRSKSQSGYGWRYLQQALKQHRIASSIQEQALSEVSPDWDAIAQRLCEKHHDKEPLKLKQFLYRRGF